MAPLDPTNVREKSRTQAIKEDADGYADVDVDQEDSGSERDESDFLLEEDPLAEKKLVRKLDSRILPIVCLMYLFAYLDRSNLGNARLQGLPQDTLHGDPTGKLFDWVNSAFFFSYILVQTPATIASKLIAPRLWLGGAAVGWGLCSTLMASAFNFAGLLVARVGLGFFEAGFGPGIPLYLSFYYTKTELGLRMGYWFGFAAVAGAFGGLIAFGVQHATNPVVQTWRLLFIIEGIPSILSGILALLLLPDRPESMPSSNSRRFSMRMTFSEKERQLAIRRQNRDARADVGRGVDIGHIKAALLDWRIYVGGIVYFGLNNALASISAFLPTIIKTFGFTDAISQLLTVPPYAVAAVVLTLLAYFSDRTQIRGPYMVGASALGGIGYLILLLVPTNIHARYFACFCITSGTYTTIGLIIAWYAHNLASETKKATGIPMFMAIGQCGSVLGSHIYPATEGPLYIKGFAISCALEFLSAICVGILSISYLLENRTRDRLYGPPASMVSTHGKSGGGKVDTRLLADKAPEFRYLP